MSPSGVLVKNVGGTCVCGILFILNSVHILWVAKLGALCVVPAWGYGKTVVRAILQFHKIVTYCAGSETYSVILKI